MKIKKIICAAAAAAVAMSSAAFAMPTAHFDDGMRRGINYYGRGLYYEARDEFQWFCDANWGKMNSGQRQYALDYLDGAKAKVSQWERSYSINVELVSLVGKTYAEIKQKYGSGYNMGVWYEGGIAIKHGDYPYGFGYDSGYSFPSSYSRCKVITATVADLIPNSKWVYTKSELDKVIGTTLSDETGYEMYSNPGLSFDYKGKHIVIWAPYGGWDGKIYADYGVDIWAR